MFSDRFSTIKTQCIPGIITLSQPVFTMSNAVLKHLWTPLDPFGNLWDQFNSNMDSENKLMRVDTRVLKFSMLLECDIFA